MRGPYHADRGRPQGYRVIPSNHHSQKKKKRKQKEFLDQSLSLRTMCGERKFAMQCCYHPVVWSFYNVYIILK